MGCCWHLVYTRATCLQNKKNSSKQNKKWERGGRIDSRNKQQTGRQKRRSETLLKDGDTKNAMMNDTMEKDARRRRRRWQYRLEILTEKKGKTKQSCWKWHSKSSQQDGKDYKKQKNRKRTGNRRQDSHFLCWGEERIQTEHEERTIHLNCLKKQPPGQFCLRERVREKAGVGSIKGSRKPPEQNTWRQY